MPPFASFSRLGERPSGCLAPGMEGSIATDALDQPRPSPWMKMKFGCLATDSGEPETSHMAPNVAGVIPITNAPSRLSLRMTVLCFPQGQRMKRQSIAVARLVSWGILFDRQTTKPD